MEKRFLIRADWNEDCRGADNLRLLIRLNPVM